VFTVSSDPETFMGDDVKVTVTAKNVSGVTRTINGTLVIGTTYYTGVAHDEILNKPIEGLVLESNEGSFNTLCSNTYQC